MQVIEIRSTHDLTVHQPEERAAASRSYRIHCGQFFSQFRQWEKNSSHDEKQTLGLMTLGMDRIWITDKEGQEIAEAIRDSRSPVILK